MLRGSRQLVTRKSGVSPACYEEAGNFQTISTCPDGLATSPTSSYLVVNLLRWSWRRRQQVRGEVTGKLVPVEFELIQWCAELCDVDQMHCSSLCVDCCNYAVQAQSVSSSQDEGQAWNWQNDTQHGEISHVTMKSFNLANNWWLEEMQKQS